MGMLVVVEPAEFQGKHEEADTLLAFHAYRIGGRIMVRSSDTDVLIILLGFTVRMPETSTIMMDFGSANNRRLINVTDISRELEKKQIGLNEALIGFHALTGCDFNSAFYRKGKSTPFSYLEKDEDHVSALRSLCSDVIDTPAITAYVCRVYGFKALSNINVARYQSFIKMTHGKHKDVKVKKINCSSLPPCEKTLAQHLSRANYIAIVWRLAHTPEPTKNVHPLNYGWTDNGDGHYVPQWFVGEPLPDKLFNDEDAELEQVHDDESDMVSDTEMDPRGADTDVGNESDDTIIADYDEESLQSDDQPWSEDSESDYEDND